MEIVLRHVAHQVHKLKPVSIFCTLLGLRLCKEKYSLWQTAILLIQHKHMETEVKSDETTIIHTDVREVLQANMRKNKE